MIMYIVCIMSFVWRTGTTDDANRGPMTPKDALALRIIVTAVLSLGLIYFTLIASTLRRYGEMMDRAWQRRILYQYDHLFWSRVTEADEEKSFSELSRSQFFLKSWSAVSRKCEISLLKICKKIGKIFSTSYPNTSVHLARRICS